MRETVGSVLCVCICQQMPTNTQLSHSPVKYSGFPAACPHCSGAVLSVLLLAVHVLQGALTCHDPGEGNWCWRSLSPQGIQGVCLGITKIGRDLRDHPVQPAIPLDVAFKHSIIWVWNKYFQALLHFLSCTQPVRAAKTPAEMLPAPERAASDTASCLHVGEVGPSGL